MRNTTIKRYSGIESLRLLAMLGIVICHWGGHGSWSENLHGGLLVNRAFMQLFEYFGEIGNCIFILITGYFCANKSDISYGGIKRVVGDVKFYAVTIWLITLILGYIEFSPKALMVALFPILYSAYWFIVPYLVVLLLSPWINNIIKTESKQMLIGYFVILGSIEIIFPMLKANTISSNFGLFCFVYSVGAWLRLNGKYAKEIERRSGLLFVFSLSLLFVFLLISDYIESIGIVNFSLAKKIDPRFSFVPLICALGLFFFFYRLKFQHDFINKIAQSAFSVYLISENPNVYSWFWKKTFDNCEFSDSTTFILLALVQSFIVLICCIIIDQIYKMIRDRIAIPVYRYCFKRICQYE